MAGRAAAAGHAGGKVASSNLARSSDVLLLVDFINPLDFPGGEDLAPHALDAAKATAELRRALDARQVQCIYANDNYGIWHDDFKDIWSTCSKAGWRERQDRAMAQAAPA